MKHRVLFAFLAFMLLMATSSSHAQTAATVQKEIDARNEEIARLEREIREYETKLNAVSKEANTLKGHIKTLDLTKSKLTTNLKVTKGRVEETTEKIASLSTEIGDKEETIVRHKLVLADLIQGIHQQSDSSLVESLLSEGGISAAWQDLDQSIQVKDGIKNQLDILHGTKVALEGDKTEAEQIREHLEELQERLADEQKIVEGNIAQKNRILSQTKNEESAYKKILAEKQARKEALDAEIREYESKLRYDYDPKALPRDGSRPLVWPLEKVYITQQFGRTVAAKRLYASGSHSGVDFRASIGTPVMAMADGVVLGVGDTDDTCPGASFGKWVYIKYDNNLASAYGHLSLIKAKEGQRVSAGDVVAYSGNTGHTTGPHLHVTVYDGNASKVTDRPSAACAGAIYRMPLAPTAAYLDPLQYLPKL